MPGRQNTADEHWMWRALALARRAAGQTAPNPLVGAIVVREGKAVGRGFHARAGDWHAEVLALDQAGELARGATLYVTLEPCNHFGRTPPCVERVLASGVRRVVIAMRDSNPAHCGGGLERLQSAGIQTELGVLEEQAARLNAGWVSWIQTGRPYLTLKLAVSQDGKIAWPDGRSKWISGAVSRAHVHRHRALVDAVLVGSETARVDNPALTNRSGRGGQPLRVVLDRQLDLPAGLQLFVRAPVGQIMPGKTLRICSAGVAAKRRTACSTEAVEVLAVPECDAHLDLQQVLVELGRRGVRSVLCEGGAGLAEGLINAGLVNELHLYRAPLTIGSGGREFKIPKWHLLESRAQGMDLFERYQVS